MQSHNKEVSVMRVLNARRLPACLLAAMSSVALAGLGATGASAATQCSGANITGQGAAVLKIAEQNVWGPGFHTSANPAACDGSQGSKGEPTVNYTSTSSGVGLDSWGVAKGVASFAPTNAFIGTEEPPSPADKAEIEANETTKVANSLQTIPVAQESIVVIVHLPTGCTASNTIKKDPWPGRLVLNNTTLQKIWLGEITKWSQITDSGDSLSGAGCEPNTPITPVVRLDSAGSTHILKKYLELINSTGFETESATTATWGELAEGAGNTVWPKAAGVVRPAKTGDSAEVSKVAETPGSIGYAGLADTRANSAFVPAAGGPGTSTFWVPLENNGTTTAKPKYADPSTDEESATTANANCASTSYTNGKGQKFPPKATDDAWNEVTTSTKEKKYPLCGITYELALSKYSAYPGTSEGEATTVNNYLLFELETEANGGQQLIVGHDYEPIPTKLIKEARAGAALVTF
jgi:ABC-type phosphate transport system substrate-binding protein